MVCQVDCAYYSDELQEVDLDPGTELKQLLQARGLEDLEASCPQCFENQQKLVSRSHHTCILAFFHPHTSAASRGKFFGMKVGSSTETGLQCSSQEC